MGAILSIQAEEIVKLKDQVEQKFLALRPDLGPLRKNSFKGSYRGLEECMADHIASKEIALSQGLLRKLFYDSVQKDTGESVTEMSFNSDFLNACYWFISDNGKNRSQYLKERPAPLETAPSENPKLNLRWLVIGGILLVILLVVLYFSGVFGGATQNPGVSNPEILVSKYVGEKEDEGKLQEGEVKIGLYLKTELDQYLKTRMAEEVIGSEGEADQLGTDAGVKFVIWGEVLGLSEAYITLATRFQLIDLPAGDAPRDSLLLEKLEAFKRATYPIGERGSCEFQQTYSEEWACIALFAVGLADYLERDYSEARKSFEKYLSNCEDGAVGNSANAHYYLGNISFDEGNLEEARGSYQKALQGIPKDQVLLTNMGSTLAEIGVREDDLGLLDSAATYFERALAVNPDHERAVLNLVMVTEALRAGETQMAATERSLPRDSTPARDSVPVLAPSGSMLDCFGGLPKGLSSRSISKKQLQKDLLAFVDETEQNLSRYSYPEHKDACQKKINYARSLFKKGNLINGVPTIWTFYNNIGKDNQRVVGTMETLECFDAVPAKELKGMQNKLEDLIFRLMDMYLERGDTWVAREDYQKAYDAYQNVIPLSSFYESTSDDPYASTHAPANRADKYKAIAFLKMGWTHLIVGSEGKFCQHVSWAQFPANIPNTFNPSWLREYNLRNQNDVEVTLEEVKRGLRCCE